MTAPQWANNRVFPLLARSITYFIRKVTMFDIYTRCSVYLFACGLRLPSQNVSKYARDRPLSHHSSLVCFQYILFGLVTCFPMLRQVVGYRERVQNWWVRWIKHPNMPQAISPIKCHGTDFRHCTESSCNDWFVNILPTVSPKPMGYKPMLTGVDYVIFWVRRVGIVPVPTLSSSQGSFQLPSTATPVCKNGPASMHRRSSSMVSIVAKGYDAISTSASVHALKKVDLPAEGLPTKPIIISRTRNLPFYFFV